jgi:hypothetical protein
MSYNYDSAMKAYTLVWKYHFLRRDRLSDLAAISLVQFLDRAVLNVEKIKIPVPMMEIKPWWSIS